MSSVAGPRSLRQLLEAVTTIGSDLDLGAMLQRIIQSAVDLVDARYGALGVLDPTGNRLSQFITVGLDDDTRAAIGHLPEGHGILGLLIVDAKPIRLPDLREHPASAGFPPNHPPMQSFLGVPIRVRDDVFGNLYLTDKQSAEVFTDVDEELVVGLASAAGVAIENARLAARVQELVVVEDRERIARDLHDTVIQRLFATGMSLQSTVGMVGSENTKVVGRIEQAVNDLDLTIKEIRTAIFGLERTRAGRPGLRHRILELVREAAGALRFEPRLFLDGPIDSTVSDQLAEDVIATLREALSNVARHARARHVDVQIVVGDDVCMTIIDDGIGFDPPSASAGHGMANMAARANGLGGTLDVRPVEPTGTSLVWRVPAH